MLFEEVFRSASTSSPGVGGRLNGNVVFRVEATLRQWMNTVVEDEQYWQTDDYMRNSQSLSNFL